MPAHGPLTCCVESRRSSDQFQVLELEVQLAAHPSIGRRVDDLLRYQVARSPVRSLVALGARVPRNIPARFGAHHAIIGVVEVELEIQFTGPR